jgi:hypothetical protein
MTINDVSGPGISCIQSIVPVNESGEFEASEDAIVNCTVRTVKTKTDVGIVKR